MFQPRIRKLTCLVAMGLWSAAGSVSAQNIVSASPDITLEVAAGVVATDGDVVVDNQLGIVGLANLGIVPEASDVIALAVDSSGDRLIAFDTTTVLGASVVARPGDVVRYDGANYSIEFDASANGLPQGVMTDAAAIASGGLLLSFDTTVDLGGGLVAADEDLVLWNGVAYSLALDGSSVGLDPALDVDAAQDLGGAGFLMSFDTAGEISNVVFDDEDIVRFDGSLWSLEFDASAADANWTAADMNAFMVPEPASAALLCAGLAWLVLLARGPSRERLDVSTYNDCSI